MWPACDRTKQNTIHKTTTRWFKIEMCLYLANDTIQGWRIWSSFSTCPYPYLLPFICSPLHPHQSIYLYNLCASADKTLSCICAGHYLVCSLGKHSPMLTHTYARIYTHTHNARTYTQRNLYSLEYCNTIDYQHFNKISTHKNIYNTKLYMDKKINSKE